jgi:hypothetical protein
VPPCPGDILPGIAYGEISAVVHFIRAVLAARAPRLDPISAGLAAVASFRIVGIAVGGVLEMVHSIITLPARLIRKI